MSSENDETKKEPIYQESGPSPTQSSMEQNNATNSDSSTTSTETLVRENVGSGMKFVSDLINRNLAAFRYGTVATVTLLTAYGLSNTPLFFRYQNVKEIPAKIFTKRQRLRVRMVEVLENDQAGQPLRCYVRHLSPAGSLLSRNLHDFIMKVAPSAQIVGHHEFGSSDQNQNRDLIKVEIAGLSAPPFYKSNGYQRGDWLNELANEKTMMKIQLLGRRVSANVNKSESGSSHKRSMTAVLPEVKSAYEYNRNNVESDDGEEQIAVCRLYYRPSLFQLFATDLALPLVRYGHAVVESQIFHAATTANKKLSKVVDASTRLDDLRRDVKYLDRLAKLEFEAARQSHGMWADPMIRERRRDIIDEVEFQENANMVQRLWRWLRR